MSTELDPVAGQWYRHLDRGQTFVVIDVDTENGTVETQHYDGDLEEIDRKAWYDLNLEFIETPEDWTGPVDDVEMDDLGYSETGITGRDWPRPPQERTRNEQEDRPEFGSEDERTEGRSGTEQDDANDDR
jgi:hypothetical protein